MTTEGRPASRYTCHSCGYSCDTQTQLGGTSLTGVRTGDVSVCAACGALGIFLVGPLGITVRPVTPAEHDELIQHDQMRQILAHRARILGDRLRPETR